MKPITYINGWNYQPIQVIHVSSIVCATLFGVSIHCLDASTGVCEDKAPYWVIVDTVKRAITWGAGAKPLLGSANTVRLG